MPSVNFGARSLSPVYGNLSGTSALLAARFCREAIDIIASNNISK